MSCIISKQIAAHVNDEEALRCATGDCDGQLTFENYHRPSFSEIYTCDNCGTVHYLDEEGLTHA